MIPAIDDLSLPIRPSPDGHLLATSSGAPFFWLADTAWELFHRLERDQAEAYLMNRAQKGFNVIQVTATGKVDLIGLDAPNRYGEIPFLDRDPTRPNPRYFEFVDWFIDRAADYGIRVALLPAWGLTFVSGPTDVRAFTEDSAETYGRWLGDRYRDKGIIWVLGGDVTPLWPDSPEWFRKRGDESPMAPLIDFRAIYDAMAKGLKEAGGQHQFISYHSPGCSPNGAAVPRTSLYFSDRTWLDMNMIQSSHSRAGPGADGGGDHRHGSVIAFSWNSAFNYMPIQAEYVSKPPRPVIDAEPGYESHPIYGPNRAPLGQFQPHQVRSALYQSHFAGAAGHTYGNFSVWDFYDPALAGTLREGTYDRAFAGYDRLPWTRALDAPGAGQMVHAKHLMLSRPYFSRVPEQSLIVGDAGQGEAHVAATRGRDGSYAFIYIPDGRAVTIDMTRLAGLSAVGWWFDPRTGKSTRITGEFATNQLQRFAPPSQGMDHDWVLVIDDASVAFSDPGAVTEAEQA
jgi:hypothetical protein